MNSPASFPPKRRFEHNGSVDWKCSTCSAEGTQAFTNLRTATESPTVADYDGVLIETEIAHALTGCNGRLVSGGGFRWRMVEHKEG
jgi:hypothetical protein